MKLFGNVVQWLTYCAAFLFLISATNILLKGLF